MKYFHNMLKAVCFAVLLPILAAGCSGCNISTDDGNKNDSKNSMLIMTWNVQNLFDGKDDGTEYPEFSEEEGWTKEKYRGRLNVIAAAFESMGKKPDVIAMQEVESLTVMNDLASSLSKYGYRWTLFGKIPGMALGLGLISRFPLTSTKTHSVYVDGEITPRPMLETLLVDENNNPSLVLFVCHWKSKLGGDDITESTRRASARIILRRLSEMKESGDNFPAIVMGDLNENYDEFYRRSGAEICALLPDDPHSAELANLYGIDESSEEIDKLIGELQQDFIIITKNKPPSTRFFPAGTFSMYSPWADEVESTSIGDGSSGDIGTYYYRNDWETIDHFLLSAELFDGKNWDFERCLILNSRPFASARGLPVSYNLRTGSGLSDHLPLLLHLKKVN